MDTEHGEMNTEQTVPPKRKLTTLAKVIFFLAVPLLTFADASGALGAFGFPVMLIAAALNVILALEFSDSAPMLLALLFVNLVPFATLTVMSLSFLASVNALFVLALSFPVFIGVRMGLGRSTSIAMAAIAATLVWCVSFAFAVLSFKGSLGIAEITAYLDELVAPIGQELSQIGFEENGQTVPFFTSADIENLLYYFKSMLLGTAAALMIVWAYLTTLAVRIISTLLGTAWRLPGSMRVNVKALMTENGPKLEISHEPVIWRIDIDSVSVWVYIAVYIAMLIFGTAEGGMRLFHTAVTNMFIILSPGFIYCALREIFLGARGKTSGKPRFLPFIIGAVLLFLNPSTIIYLLCAFGAVTVLRDNRLRRNSEKIRKG